MENRSMPTFLLELAIFRTGWWIHLKVPDAGKTLNDIIINPALWSGSLLPKNGGSEAVWVIGYSDAAFAELLAIQEVVKSKWAKRSKFLRLGANLNYRKGL
ncbi:hypothetical protein GQ457_05G007880 [Hibiscus cannabinus]